MWKGATLVLVSSAKTWLLVGRDFAEAERAPIREVVALFPRLNRKELAARLSKHLGWVTPAGRLKVESCLELLERIGGQRRELATSQGAGGVAKRGEALP